MIGAVATLTLGVAPAVANRLASIRTRIRIQNPSRFGVLAR
jgi:hypothetical protein